MNNLMKNRVEYFLEARVRSGIKYNLINISYTALPFERLYKSWCQLFLSHNSLLMHR